ncbi:MAG: TrmB family transcriptional regulator sugar-binding domain-containing protein, partial [Candidatus Hermodarchaeota archaeon]
MIDFTFLNELGLTDIQIKIYDYILNNKFGTTNKIKSVLNYSYTQVRNNLNVLVDKKLISSSLEEKERVYYRINPKYALNEILDAKNKDILKKIEKLNEDLEARESIRGVCIKEISFYQHSDFRIGVENLISLIDNATNEIILTSIPPNLLELLKGSFHDAFMRGVKLNLYYSNRDFDKISNYFDIITEILKNTQILIIEKDQKTCRNIRFNDMVVNEGLIVIDEGFFNSISFIDDTIFL